MKIKMVFVGYQSGGGDIPGYPGADQNYVDSSKRCAGYC